MAKRYITVAETIAVRDLLTQHLHRSELRTPEGIHVWRYDEGWSDDKIAKAVSPELNPVHTQQIRHELFGPIKGGVPAPKPKPDRVPGQLGTLESRVATLERLVRHLCAELGVPCNPDTGT